MKRIVLCFDGTWNKPSDENLPARQQVETNVSRFFKSLSDAGRDGARQVKWYDEGVGTAWYDRFLGGAFGVGLETTSSTATSFWRNSIKTATKSTCWDSAGAPTRLEVSSA
jgi:uncharacterized protein (DUF2235 family)